MPHEAIIVKRGRQELLNLYSQIEVLTAQGRWQKGKELSFKIPRFGAAACFAVRTCKEMANLMQFFIIPSFALQFGAGVLVRVSLFSQ